MALNAGSGGRSNVLPDTPTFAFRRLTQRRVWVESPLRRTELDIYWIPRSFKTNRRPVGYNVYRSVLPRFVLPSPQTTKLNTSLVVIPLYRDLTVDTKEREHWYYTVTEVFADGSETALDEPVTLYGNLVQGRRTKNISMPRIFSEWRRRKYIILENDAEQVDILIRRLAGPRCDCFSGEYERSADPNCSTCYGTGYARGYEVVRDVLLRVLTVQEVLKLKPEGLQFTSNPRAWLVDFPILRNGDVVVRRIGERAEINNVEFNIHQGILTEQSCELIVMDRLHPIYNYDIPSSDA